MKNTQKTLIKVFADWAGLPKTMMMGILQADHPITYHRQKPQRRAASLAK